MRKFTKSGYRAIFARSRREASYLRERWLLLTRNRKKHDGLGGIWVHPSPRYWELEKARARCRVMNEKLRDEDDPYAATRRAIVRAAAAMGEQE